VISFFEDSIQSRLLIFHTHLDCRTKFSLTAVRGCS